MQKSENEVIYVVDDDEGIRDSLRWLLESVGYTVQTFDNGEGFMESYEPLKAGCAIIDIRMPGIGGLQLLDMLQAQPRCMPIIVITGHGDVPLAVRAMKSGAVEFFEKPFNDQELLDRIERALAQDRVNCDKRQLINDVAERLNSLTPREHETMLHVLAGLANKEIGHAMGVTVKTVEFHRARVMDKMRVRSGIDLSQLIHSVPELEKNLS